MKSSVTIEEEAFRQQPVTSQPVDDRSSQASATNEQNVIIHDSNSNNSISDPTQADFSVIWHNLTYKVDSRRWYTKAKRRFIDKNSDASLEQFQSEDKIYRSSLNSNTGGSGEKIILNKICGHIKSRQLTAIMGPSGAGKSTLLHCLFQNRTAGTTGRILVDSCRDDKLKVCFIPQHDYLNEWLTVREDLIFVSRLKLARISSLSKEGPSVLQLADNEQEKTKSYVRQDGKECNTSLIDHEANALRVAGLLGLNNCLDVMIKKISGGQKKRLSIARELMSKPDILILDEPTTGLDSLTCYKTVKVLRDIVRLSPNPMAIVVTIHQPQIEVFNLFDKTYFISNRGRIVYDDHPRRSVEILDKVAQQKLPVPNYNPALFLIELASDDSKRSARDKLSAHQLTEFSKLYDSNCIGRLMQAKPGSNGAQNWKFCVIEGRPSQYSASSFGVQSLAAPGEGNYSVDELSDETTVKVVNGVSGRIKPVHDYYFISHHLADCLSGHSNSLLQSFRHVFILTHRSWLSVIRNPTFTKSRLAFHIILPLMMLVVFGTSMGAPNNCPKFESELDISQMNKNIKTGTIARNVEEMRLSIENLSFYFILIYGFGINIISCTASFYPLTMHMFKKESINGLYSAGPYFIGQMLAELPLEIFFPSISILLSYHISGQISSFLEWRMFCMSFIVFLVNYCTHSLGLLSGSIFVNNISVSVLFGQVLLLPQVMLSGFLIRPTRMPDWMRTASVTSPFKHVMNAIMATRYGFNICGCEDDMIPLEGETIDIKGMTPQVKRVIEYMFPKNESNVDEEFSVTEIFEKLGSKFVKSQTFALDLKSCDDFRPYLLHVFDVHDSDLFYGIFWLLVTTIILKVITFSIMRSFPYRIS